MNKFLQDHASKFTGIGVGLSLTVIVQTCSVTLIIATVLISIGIIGFIQRGRIN